jgi:hypothetical protein
VPLDHPPLLDQPAGTAGRHRPDRDQDNLAKPAGSGTGDGAADSAKIDGTFGDDVSSG